MYMWLSLSLSFWMVRAKGALRLKSFIRFVALNAFADFRSQFWEQPIMEHACDRNVRGLQSHTKEKLIFCVLSISVCHSVWRGAQTASKRKQSTARIGIVSLKKDSDFISENSFWSNRQSAYSHRQIVNQIWYESNRHISCTECVQTKSEI